MRDVFRRWQAVVLPTYTMLRIVQRFSTANWNPSAYFFNRQRRVQYGAQHPREHLITEMKNGFGIVCDILFDLFCCLTCCEIRL